MTIDRKRLARWNRPSGVICCTLLFLTACEPPPTNGPVTPLPRAHAHNDYRHARPLHDALARGFTSVEADIFLVDDDLYVAHDRWDIRPERTLRALYLDPLRERIQQHGGSVYPDGPPFTLLIDIKSDAEATYRRLHEMLAEYSDVFACFGEDCPDGPVVAIVSGNRPLAMIRSQKPRYAACDGRLSDLDSEVSAEVMPMISDHWGRHFTWRGAGPIPPDERRRLHDIVEKAHRAGRRVRFWATPDRPSPAREAVWRELLSADVDLINTDDLPGLQQFLLAHQADSKPAPPQDTDGSHQQ